ncbi:MAG: secretion protein HlyD [Xanthomonadales bacterium]|nr:PQQ-dependent sugar dehydrogenase [Gammaproteobacteria bacterium]MBT8051061.1 PQQ-dependent sugar dehydrogenase [Gammaproteobacteria bacterium]MBT8055616.1 PQQ-dependent sugar dehydrogenase [Gammaproteobacteria bacterium]NNJ80496.1 secretion protein HlyD [Xanthomonadales bacterium]NNL05432.1 secretion protein HlyD [Xanthomonadales bacterium]
MRHTLLLAILLGLTLPALAQNRSGQGDVREIYDANCAGCHGDDLAGGSGSSLIDDVWLNGSRDDQIAHAIRVGVVDMGMPGWQDTLSDEQIRALVIFIREMKAKSESGALEKRLQGNIVNAAGHRYRLEEVGEGDSMLWSIAFLPDGSRLVTQRDGVLWHFEDGKRSAVEGTPEVWQHGQGGLLEVAPHPDYAENGWVYLSYSENTGAMENDKDAGMTTVVRGRIETGLWVDQERLFRSDGEHHTSSGAHFGSRFVFDGGYLFFSIGDRGRKERSQDLDRPSGKILRIHDDGRVPADNPFVGVAGALPEIWSYGHRNPQGMDRDPATGLMWESEHGPRGGDEINVVERGKNYGWPVITHGMNYNGTPITDETHREGMEQPKLHWTPSIAVAGIDFYEGDAFPGWKGKLLAGGMASEELHLLTVSDGSVTKDVVVLKGRGRIRDVASGPDGFIYLLLNDGSPRTGRIVRMVPAD